MGGDQEGFKMGLEILLKNHLTALKSVFIVLILMSCAIAYVGSKSGYDLDIFVFFGIFTVLNVGPAIVLHLEYYSCNKKKKYWISKNSIVEFQGEFERSFKVEEIDRIVFYMPPSVLKGSEIKFLAIEEYYFAKVIFKNNESIILTCLLSNKLESVLSQLENIKIVRKKALFASVSFWA